MCILYRHNSWTSHLTPFHTEIIMSKKNRPIINQKAKVISLVLVIKRHFILTCRQVFINTTITFTVIELVLLQPCFLIFSKSTFLHLQPSLIRWIYCSTDYHKLFWINPKPFYVWSDLLCILNTYLSLHYYVQFTVDNQAVVWCG